MTPDFRKVLDGWAFDNATQEATMQLGTPDQNFLDDERDFSAQQAIDDEARELRLIDILRRMAEGVPVSRDDVALIAAGCGIDKRDVL